MTRLSCDGPTLIRSVAAAVANLERHAAEVDALNVFPVPDGDTGSNMLATLRAALAEAERLPADDRQLGRVAEALARGAIRGARGNSGVILAEIIRGMTIGADGRRRATGPDLAAGLRSATESAYGSVLDPVEGTILTVIRDAAEAAETEATRHRHVERVLSAAVVGAARSVDRTPGLLAVLADAGVVDSGGQGLLRILEGTLLLDGSDRERPVVQPRDVPAAPVAAVPDVAPPKVDGAFGYETVYLIESPDAGLDLMILRTELHSLGDSVVVAGDRRLARVHIHGPRPDLALAVGLRLGRLSDISVIDLDADTAGARHEAPARGGQAPTTPLGLVAFAEADGAASLLARVQVGRVVRPAAGRQPSAAEVAEAVAAVRGRHVLVLARDADDARAVDAASDLVPGVEVTVVLVGDIAGAVAAALAFDPGAPAAENAERMAAEAGRLRRVDLGSGEAIDAVIERIRAIEGDGIEVATVYAGDRLHPTVEDALRAAIVAAWPGIEVDVVFAGQRGDSALVALD